MIQVVGPKVIHASINYTWYLKGKKSRPNRHSFGIGHYVLNTRLMHFIGNSAKHSQMNTINDFITESPFHGRPTVQCDQEQQKNLILSKS